MGSSVQESIAISRVIGKTISKLMTSNKNSRIPVYVDALQKTGAHNSLETTLFISYTFFSIPHNHTPYSVTKSRFHADIVVSS